MNENAKKYFEEVIDRIKIALNTDKDTVVAEALNLQITAFYNRRKNGSLPLKNIINWANKKQVSVDWLVTGKGFLVLTDAEIDLVKKNNDGHHDIPTDQPTITELITKTIEILESKTVYGNALSANIQAFHKAATLEQKFNELQVGMNKMEGRITAVEAENSKLREQIKDISEDGGGMVANKA